MAEDRNNRRWLFIAAIAIMVAVVLLLAPQVQTGHAIAWLAILPVFFIGVISLLLLLPAPGSFHRACAKDAPALQPDFQRPPPLPIA